jgi:Polyketide cyclase / dehydrase and lipid transport
MIVRTEARSSLSTSPESIFDLLVDAARFPPTFRSFGPVPGIRSITLDGPLRVGAIRRVHNADGSELVEQVTILDRPAHHAYTLAGFQPPFSWLVTHGQATWSMRGSGGETEVVWRYAFNVASPLAYPVCALVIRYFMRKAMQRCLRDMAKLLGNEDR